MDYNGKLFRHLCVSVSLCEYIFTNSLFWAIFYCFWPFLSVFGHFLTFFGHFLAVFWFFYDFRGNIGRNGGGYKEQDSARYRGWEHNFPENRRDHGGGVVAPL